MTTLGDTYRPDGHLTACLDPLHHGPCKGWKGHSEEAFDKVTGRSKRGIRAYNKAKTARASGSGARKALLSYVNGSGPINRSLRASGGKGSNDPRIVADIARMDRAMQASKLDHPIVVQRAVSPSAFGGKDTNIDLTGAEYTDHAFGSTGTDLNLILKHFHTTSSGKKPLIADITVPKGVGAIRVPPGQWGDEKEILLERGAHYRVVRDNGFITTPKGKFRHVTLEVVPGDPGKITQMDLGDKNQQHRDSVQASAMTLGQILDPDCTFCMQTHKPGLCKGQKRGETEPGAQDATKQTPAQVAQTAVTGLSKAISQAQQAIVANPTNPKLQQAARKAIADYQKALKPHQQTLKDAARTNAGNARTAKQDATQQDTLDRQKANADKRAEAKKERAKETLQKRAQAIKERRAEAARVAKMSPKQRAAYGKRQSAIAKAKHKAAEDKVLKEAGKG